MRCSRCQTENRENRRFCGSCGAALARACDCGRVNNATDRFCGGCGRLLEREAEAAVDRPEETAGARRPVAIMFCDLVGYTRPSSKLDWETRRRSAASYGPPEPRQGRFCPGTADLLDLT
jgi:hypothetical protein